MCIIYEGINTFSTKGLKEKIGEVVACVFIEEAHKHIARDDEELYWMMASEAIVIGNSGRKLVGKEKVRREGCG